MGMIQEGDYTIRYKDKSAILYFFKLGFEIKVDQHNHRGDNLIMAFNIAESYIKDVNDGLH